MSFMSPQAVVLAVGNLRPLVTALSPPEQDGPDSGPAGLTAMVQSYRSGWRRSWTPAPDERTDTTSAGRERWARFLPIFRKTSAGGIREAKGRNRFSIFPGSSKRQALRSLADHRFAQRPRSAYNHGDPNCLLEKT